jgi:hypothetical protein
VRLNFWATPRADPDALAVGAAKKNPTITFGWDSADGPKSAGSAGRDEITADYFYLDGAPPSVPLPTPFWSTMATLGGLAGIGVVRWFRRREV